MRKQATGLVCRAIDRYFQVAATNESTYVMRVASSYRSIGKCVTLGLAVLLLACLPGAVFPITTSHTGASEDPREAMERASRMRALCGPNALYVLLNLPSRGPDYAQVLQAFPPNVGSDGASLLDIRAAANTLGERLEIVKCSTVKLRHMDTPFLVYARGRMGEPGHYLVVVGTDREALYVVDAVLGEVLPKGYGAIDSWFGGYAVVSSSSALQAGDFTFLTALIGIAILLLFGWYRPSTHSSRKRVAVAVIAITVAIATHPTAFAAPTEKAPRNTGQDERFSSPGSATDSWRTPEKDGVNVLYILARVNGVNVSYEEVDTLVDQQTTRSACNLHDLRLAAEHLGLDVAVSRCTPRELADQLPAIVSLDAPGQDHGGFVLVSHLGQRALIINGSWCNFENLTMDQFRRDWSGYCLVVRKHMPLVWGWRISSFVLGVAIGAFFIKATPFTCLFRTKEGA